MWNDNGRLARQREAEYHRDMVALEQTQQRVIVQVKTSLGPLEPGTATLGADHRDHVAGQRAGGTMERLFTAGQTDLVKLLTVRQRWLDSANTQLDATWQATQSYGELLASLGGVPLLGTLPIRPQR